MRPKTQMRADENVVEHSPQMVDDDVSTSIVHLDNGDIVVRKSGIV